MTGSGKMEKGRLSISFPMLHSVNSCQQPNKMLTETANITKLTTAGSLTPVCNGATALTIQHKGVDVVFIQLERAATSSDIEKQRSVVQPRACPKLKSSSL